VVDRVVVTVGGEADAGPLDPAVRPRAGDGDGGRAAVVAAHDRNVVHVAQVVALFADHDRGAGPVGDVGELRPALRVEDAVVADDVGAVGFHDRVRRGAADGGVRGVHDAGRARAGQGGGVGVPVGQARRRAAV